MKIKKVTLYDKNGGRYEFIADDWQMNNDMYKFYLNNKIIAIFVKDTMTGFMLEEKEEK